jgi:hypothetical protein
MDERGADGFGGVVIRGLQKLKKSKNQEVSPRTSGGLRSGRIQSGLLAGVASSA